MQIDDPGRPLTSIDLATLERELGVKLPGDYHSFLLANNGGMPSPGFIDVQGAPGSPTDIQVFFGVDRSVGSSSLTWNRRAFQGRIPDRLLPIACDSGGNLFCVSVSGPATGEISYV